MSVTTTSGDLRCPASSALRTVERGRPQPGAEAPSYLRAPSGRGSRGRAALTLIAATTLALGCSTTQSDRASDIAPSAIAATPRPAPILHVVLIRLKNPLDTAELADDCLAAAADIPSITSAFAGLHLETGRDTVVRDYDLCFTLGFDTREGYEAYIVHPAHTALLEKWIDRVEWLRIHDAQDVRP